MLQDKLQAFKKQVYQDMPKETTTKFDKQIQELRDMNFASQGLKVGDTIPMFILNNAKDQKVSSKEILENNPIVINFYRGGWCPYCNLELRALQQFLPEFENLGTKLIAISPEKPDNSMSTVEKNELKFEVLTDTDNKLARDFGIVFEFPEYLDEAYNGFGLDLKKHNNSKKVELPLPATYVVDQTGTIRYAFADEDYTMRANPEDILEALKGI
ncbi:peroxiredoxin-like family protein [Marinifilum sp. D714]|uniref:peroxiredoxin-like family protein n=1 Tax=Marinifilum sp. D714 TaxID=2937523 RepID=UPI0027BCB247|nr:peroxiredoxin-like family protein [Marinifilum sp. D714]MDQ2177885.1 AhpC/TSA family protein [Marinifilum sp. D714]